MNEYDKFGCSLLYWGVKNSNTETVSILLSAGAEPDFQNSDGSSPLSAAADPEIITLLLEKGASPDRKNSRGNTILYEMIIAGKTEAVRALLNRKANPNLANDDGAYPLSAAVKENESEILEMLLTAGADPEKKDSDGYNSLLTAAESNASDCLQILVPKTDIHAKDPDGNTALHIAVLSDAVESLEFLLGAGLDITARNNQGKTVLDEAKTNRHALKILEQECIRRMMMAAKTGDMAAAQRLLAVTSVNCRDAEGNTPLIVASRNSQKDMADFLISRGAETYHKNRSGESA